MGIDAIEDLMLRWESARQQGVDLSPAELCADAPHLADEVQRRIRAILAMEHVLGVTEHDPNRTMPAPADESPFGAEPEPLPRIPGYEIIRIIDQGGMGVVYEARQINANRIVAIKMVSGARLKPKAVVRFRAEAESAARLQHPNVVQIFEVGEVNGKPFFSMEYVAGGTLAERLAAQPVLARDAAALVETLARAVHAAHGRGIVHRDLKPSNVMLTADGTPKIADFGLAKRLDDDSGHTHSGEVLGTPNYMAPEQAEGRKDLIGPATDIYALGAILYELLAGVPPFRGSSPLDAMRLVVSTPPTPPSQIVASVPTDLEAICLKCLEKAPEHRYASALELAEDLRRYLDGQPVTARHIGVVQHTWRYVRTHPQTAALAILVGVLFLIPAYFLIAEYRTQRQVRQRAVEVAPLAREILDRNCHECHGQAGKKPEKNLDILNHQQLIGDSRRFVVPGSPDESRLIRRIVDGSMPPEDHEKELPRVSESELTILRDWIVGGAPPLPPPDPNHPVPSAAPFSKSAAKAKEIFIARCYDCHRYDAFKGGVKILHHRALITVNKAIVPGDPDKSELFELISSKDEKHRMPPKGEDPLNRDEIEAIREWILEGAPPFPKTLNLPAKKTP
ncbi:MAG: hypothetical protein FJ303_13875 [Planctomycetes bacterium]|nr:hypothetical protein [Planctomycetota bacterium]